MGRKNRKHRDKSSRDEVITSGATVWYAPPKKDIKERHESSGVIELDEDDTPVWDLDYSEGISPFITIPRELSDKIWYITRKLDTEWLCLLIGEKQGINYTIEDIVIPKQTNTSAHTLSDEIVKVPKLIGWLHSHVNMNTFFSSEDEECNQRLPCSIVVNKKGEYKAQATVLLENGKPIKLSAGVDWSEDIDDEEEPEWFTELKPKFAEKKETTSYASVHQTKIKESVDLEDGDIGDQTKFKGYTQQEWDEADWDEYENMCMGKDSTRPPKSPKYPRFLGYDDYMY